MLTFWDTVRGVETAEAIIRLSNHMRSRRQYLLKADTKAQMLEQIEERLQHGEIYVDSFEAAENGYIAIMEKTR